MKMKKIIIRFTSPVPSTGSVTCSIVRSGAEHVTAVQKSGEYSDIYVRLAWDMARMQSNMNVIIL